MIASPLLAQNSTPGTVAPPTGAQPGETVLIDSLRGLRLINDESQLTPDLAAVWPQGGVDTARVPLLANADFDYVAGAFLGQPVSQESLQRLVQATKLLLRMDGRPFSVVYWPEQDITAGYLQLVVVESRATGEVDVQGARYFSPELYRNQVRLAAGGAIDQQALQSDLAWINRNPFRSANVTASPGDTPGTTRLVLNVRERKPWRVNVGTNNTGTKTTGEERVFAGVNFGNAFGLGHLASLNYTTDYDAHAIKSLSGTYSFDLPWRHVLAFNGVYSRTHGKLAPPFSLSGESWQLGADYVIPLRPRLGGRLSHQLTFGADFKASDNNLMFSLTPISDNLTHVVQGRISYDGSLADDWGATGWDVQLTAAPSGLTDRNEDIYFSQSRAFASADYAYARLQLTRQVNLRGPLTGWTWNARGSLQVSSDNLIGSEQFAAGGSASVRGYDEGEAYGDEAWLLSHELSLPVLRPAARLGWSEQADALSLYVFQDYARTSSVQGLAGEKPITLHSVGAGLRYQFSGTVNASFAYGTQLRDSGRSPTGRNHRGHFSLQMSF